MSWLRLAAILGLVSLIAPTAEARDFVRELQLRAVTDDYSPLGHWGPFRRPYTLWGTHSNRLIPVYTFGTKRAGQGLDLDAYFGAASAYRTAAGVRRLFGGVPSNTVNPKADYLDQTDLAALQRAALAAGRKYVFLVIFDGMDWQTTRAAAIYNTRRVQYASGRGTGLHFLDYTASGTTQFGYMVTTPHNEGTRVDVDRQTVLNPGGELRGGYNAAKAGATPWNTGSDPLYIIAKSAESPDVEGEHAYPDSAATATAMCSGTRTYNDAINVDVTGHPLVTVAHEAQDKGMAIGVVTSVPISHATPACAYAHNVHRDDYQDLTRDLVGLKSISHPQQPLAGVDVLIGGGYGHSKEEHKEQGANFVPGNVWITAADLEAINTAHGGRYVVAQRTADVRGRDGLMNAARQAARRKRRLFGFFGNGHADGHLPFQTADGDYNPTLGRKKESEKYSPADIDENPTLAEMTSAALTVLETSSSGFWLMVESGDVDWANHDNNIDNSIGAVNSGDAAVRVITDWVEKHSNWNESVMIVTADHGHYLVLEKPELLVGPDG